MGMEQVMKREMEESKDDVESGNMPFLSPAQLSIAYNVCKDSKKSQQVTCTDTCKK